MLRNRVLALELGGTGSSRVLIFILHIPGYSRQQQEEEGRTEPVQFAPCLFQPPACCWCLLTLWVSLGELFAVLVSVLAGDYAGRENKQLCHPSVHTNTLPGADCTVGKMTPKLCVMSRKRLETALAMLKIDISEGGGK